MLVRRKTAFLSHASAEAAHDVDRMTEESMIEEEHTRFFEGISKRTTQRRTLRFYRCQRKCPGGEGGCYESYDTDL
jgi:hypothetical protein